MVGGAAAAAATALFITERAARRGNPHDLMRLSSLLFCWISVGDGLVLSRAPARRTVLGRCRWTKKLPPWARMSGCRTLLAVLGSPWSPPSAIRTDSAPLPMEVCRSPRSDEDRTSRRGAFEAAAEALPMCCKKKVLACSGERYNSRAP